jgi:hypothetical protein
MSEDKKIIFSMVGVGKLLHAKTCFCRFFNYRFSMGIK